MILADEKAREEKVGMWKKRVKIPKFFEDYRNAP